MKKRVVVLVIALVMVWGSATAQLSEQQQIQKLNYAYHQIRSNYVDDVPLELLVEQAIIATLRELDPHSRYLTPEDMEATYGRLRGEFSGLGIRYISHNDTLVVRSTLTNSPAEHAGIRANDRIVAIDNAPIVGITTDSIATLLRGEIGSRVELQVMRRNDKNISRVTLTRSIVETSAITTAFRMGDVGYIAIGSFPKLLANEFLAAYESLGDITRLVVDLRDNGGGSITAAIDLTSLFLNKGDVIVSTEGRGNETAYTKHNDSLTITLPLVVLINENSASASEIFAGAIQDHDRGVIMGHTSYGKGLVQKIVNFKDGSGMTLTIARYKTPAGRVIQRHYNMGDSETYLKDSTRYQHPDSMALEYRPQYRTLREGRVVYGGGGITPDVYINTDTLKLSECVTLSASQSLFDHAVIDYWDAVPMSSLLELYSDVESFSSGYQVDNTLLGIYYNYLGCNDTELSDHDQRYIRAMLMAAMAEQLYGLDSRYRVTLEHFDPMTHQAEQLLITHY